jgi:hypothetical protein
MVGVHEELKQQVAATIGILLTIFGLTFAAVSITFSWFGLLIMIISIGIMTFTEFTWYIKSIIGFDTVIALFIIIYMFLKPNQEIG